MDARLVPQVRAAFDKYLFAEQVKMTNRLGDWHQIALHGPGAPALLDEIVGSHVAELGPLESTRVRLFDGTPEAADATAWRDDPCAVPGLHLVLPIGQAGRVWAALLSRFGELVAHARRPVRPAGWAAFNACRIEGGRPIFGIDFDDSVLPAETGQFDRAVSITKGCYLGQEIVARMHARKQVARQLVGLRVEGGHLPIAGAAAYDDAGNAIGGITSSTVSPVLSNAAICLGYLKKPFFAEGTVVQVPAEGGMRKATVVKTPFV
jgi:folate-binding protein YgfZ